MSDVRTAIRCALIPAAALATAAAAAPPLPSGKQYSIFRTETVSLFYQNGGTVVPAFDGRKGQLRSVSAKLTGTMSWQTSANVPPPAGKAYAFTAYAPAYIGQIGYCDVQATGSGTYAAGTAQPLYAKLAYAGPCSGQLAAFVGSGTRPVTVQAGFPKFSAGEPGGQLTPGTPTIGGTLTYTYLPYPLGPVTIPKKLPPSMPSH